MCLEEAMDVYRLEAGQWRSWAQLR
jgi:hypothetical protein